MVEGIKTFIDLREGLLSGKDVASSQKVLGDLANVFEDEEFRSKMPQDTVVYRVETHTEEKDGTEGGLFFGTSFINPGLVKDEYFMTRGHFHAKSDRAEYYWCIKGEGMLILMDSDRRCRAEKMMPGSLHYIPGNVAHRLANTGSDVLVVGACWPSDAGHDYKTISDQGFSARLKKMEGKPVLVGEGGRRL